MSLGPVFKVAWSGRKIRMYMPGPRSYQMAALAQVGVNSILARVSRGVGSDDTAMPQLKNKKGRAYGKYWKGKWIEFGPETPGYADMKGSRIRNLRGAGVGWTGKDGSKMIRGLGGATATVQTKRRLRKAASHMLDALRVTSASPTQARIDITTQDARIKARANEQRAPWFGFSGRDVRNLLEASRKIWGSNVAAFTAGFRGVGRAANSQVPVWMDPLGVGARASQPTIAGQMADRIQTLFGRAA